MPLVRIFEEINRIILVPPFSGAVNLDLASMSENLTPVATKPRPSSSYMVSEDVDDDDDGWLDDIQQLLNFHKRELEQDDYLQESRPAKWLKIDEGTRADPKINMMPIVLVEDIVSKIMSSVWQSSVLEDSSS